MSCHHCLFGLLGMCAFTLPTYADGIAINLELEGMLSAIRGRYQLNVPGEGVWTLQFSDRPKLEAQARQALENSRVAKVRVCGAVPVRTTGTTLQIRQRRVRVTHLTAMVPVVKVTKIQRASPADPHFQLGDQIVEVEGVRVHGFASLSSILQKHRGSKVTIVVNRSGKTIVLRDIPLRKVGVPLGVSIETTWTHPTSASPSTKPGKTRPPKMSGT